MTTAAQKKTKPAAARKKDSRPKAPSAKPAAHKPAAKVAILHHSVAKSCIDRVQGFKEAMAKFP